MSTVNVAIVGTGLAGLTTAVSLRELAKDSGLTDSVAIDVYEATDRIGGKLYTVAFEGGPTDVGAEAFDASNTDIRDFFDDLGLESEIVTASTNDEQATFTGGFAQLYEALAEASGADIYVDAFISGLTEGETTDQGRTTYRLTGGEDKTYDHVILATPAPTTALLLKKIAPEVSSQIANVKLEHAAVVCLRFTQEALAEASLPGSAEIDLSGTDGATAKAITLSSRKWPHLAEREGELVRVDFAGTGPELAITATEDDLVDHALADLKNATGIDAGEEGPEEVYVQRWFGAVPTTTETAVDEIPGISVTGNWVNGEEIGDVIANARSVAHAVAKQLL